MIAARSSVAFLLMLSSTAAFAEHGGSLEDQMACTPDVYRLCSSFIPDEDAITGCLAKNKATLSPACRKVFSEPTPGKAKAGGQPDDNN